MKKVIKTMIFMIVIFLLSYSSSYAAVVQIKDVSSSTVTNYTISDFYLMAEGLRGTGQALEGTNVDVKMANNYEWAVVSYFSNSAYGTGGEGGNTGKGGVNTGVKSHYSTNGNVTGVMDWGNTVTFTAGIISSYAGKTLTDKGNTVEYTPQNVNIILNNATTNKVDKFINSSEADYSIARTGWYGYKFVGEDADNPYSLRSGLFVFDGGVGGYSLFAGRVNGKSSSDVTFRPVFYAQ